MLHASVLVKEDSPFVWMTAPESVEMDGWLGGGGVSASFYPWSYSESPRPLDRSRKILSLIYFNITIYYLSFVYVWHPKTPRESIYFRSIYFVKRDILCN